MLSSFAYISDNIILTKGDSINALNIQDHGYPDVPAPESLVTQTSGHGQLRLLVVPPEIVERYLWVAERIL